MVQEPVEDCGGDDRIGEHHAPFGNAAVRRDQHGAGFVAPADQLEEQVRRVGLQRQVAELVDDQQLRLRQRQQFLVQRRSPCALARPATSVVAVVNCTVYPARIASRPSAIDKCVLPTPGGPSSSTFSPLAIQRDAARSRICFGSIDGCASKSKPASSFTAGKCASFSAISMRR